MALDENDFQICHEFKYSNKTINGINRQKASFTIDFKQFEENSPNLVSEIYYNNFKTNFRNYTKFSNFQKTSLRAEISELLNNSKFNFIKVV
jgi:hypothetical protein